jgi:hypothetical protein
MKTSKYLLPLVAALMASAATLTALADDAASPVTLSGLLVCGKCKLHITDKCQNVLQVDKDGKTVNYFLDQNSTSKDFHDNICTTDGEKVTVTGTVGKKDDKDTITATKIEPVK